MSLTSTLHKKMFSTLLRSTVPLAAVGAAMVNMRSPARCTAKSEFSTQIYRAKRSPLTTMKDKVVLITGASAGIGAACAMRFAENGAKLVLVGRRGDRLEELKKEINHVYPQVRILTVPLSVTDYDAVAALPKQLPMEFAEVDILVNNAGLALGVTSVESNDINDAKQVMDTNVLGTIAMCSAFLPGMKARGRGHLINMGSCAGHFSYATGSVYCASKFALQAFTSSARHDLAGTPIRVTHIAPGMVGNTEFSNVRLKDDNKAALVYQNMAVMDPDDIADNVLYAVTRPAHVQIADILVYCTNQSGPRDIVRAGPNMGAP